MSIKTKVAWGVAFLFSLIITIGGIGIYYLKSQAANSMNVLSDNYESIQYTNHIIQNCDSLYIDSANAILRVEYYLHLQEQNITEDGEPELTSTLRRSFEKLKVAGITVDNVAEMRRLALSLQGLNMNAIVKKNDLAQQTAEKASTYLIIASTLCALIAFTFIINFPGYIANPIVQLTRSIKAIANKDYEERLHFDRKDEFEELAEAFNQMAEKLDEFEHSSLANILFEKKRIETIINRMSDPVLGLDETRKVVFANDEALSLLNLQRMELIDHYAPDVAVHNDLLRNLIRENLPTDKSSNLLKVVLQGKENYFSKEVTQIQYTPTGERDIVNIGQVILLKNITPYKELDLAKTNFIATISHELKTPIASLQMGTQLLLDNRVGNLNEEQQNIVQSLHDEVVRLNKITHTLLDLSQVETGQIKLNLQSINAQEIIHAAMEAVKFQAERKHIQLECVTRPDVPMMRADFEKTTWVVVNLLTNAIRFSPEREKVLLKLEYENNLIKISVRDHGLGIEPAYQEKIFEKFYQVPGTASGTGLGLAICKEFIEAQGGTIHVESKLGQGSTFTIQLMEFFKLE